MTTESKPKTRWGMAKVEFRPLIPEIRQFLAAGWPKKAIFDKLAEQQKINMGYVAFSGLVKKEITEADAAAPPKKTRKPRTPKAEKSPVVETLPDTPPIVEPTLTMETEQPRPAAEPDAAAPPIRQEQETQSAPQPEPTPPAPATPIRQETETNPPDENDTPESDLF